MIARTFGFAAVTTGILAIQTAASAWSGCTEVSSETLFAVKNADSTYVGPQGVYATTTDNQCVFVDASAGSSFATDHPDDYAWFVSVATESDITGIDFVAPNAARGLEKRQVGCGSICDSNQSSAKRCNCGTCKYITTNCGVGGWCTSF